MVADSWLTDMPCQFSAKKNIKVLIDAFAKQMDELHEVFLQLNTMTDIGSASGKNLDMLGSILGLSRRDAIDLLDYDDSVEMTDDIYQLALRLKELKNNSECTYSDIMGYVHLNLPDTEVVFEEDPTVPATVTLVFHDANAEWPYITSRFKVIKSAGVSMLFRLESGDEVEAKAHALCGCTGFSIHESCTTLRA